VAPLLLVRVLPRPLSTPTNPTHCPSTPPTPTQHSTPTRHRACPGGMYISREHHWGFYDLSANVTFAGPGPGGKGQVLAHSIPSPSHYRPETVSRAITPDLAALVWSWTQHLVWPSLQHASVGYHRQVVVHVVYMHQDLMGTVSHVDRAALEVGGGAGGLGGLDWLTA